MSKFLAVTLETLKSKPINEKAIEKGISLYNSGRISFAEHDDFGYLAQVDDHGETRSVSISFSRDGCDLDSYFCHCATNRRNGLICKHIVATVLAIQGGVTETKVMLGKTASVTEKVDESNTARAVGSGSLDVFATPMMIALMERAACEVLVDALAEGQTSVGTFISVNHVAASPLEAQITATATITSICGRKIEFYISASDEHNEIGNGKHMRVIVDGNKFMNKAKRG